MIKTDVIIIGAGPVGLFAIHQLGIKGLKAVVIDNLDKPGGQCIELYPDKPIYDIPAVPECTGKELTDRLLEQTKPFKTKFYLNERVEEVKSKEDNWSIKTSNNNEFIAPNIIIAGGVGSFEPRKLSLKDTDKFEGKSIFYSVKNKDNFKNKNISIFGGGDSALDWALELSKSSKITLIHRRKDFRGARHTLEEIKKLEKQGKITIKTPFQLDNVEGNEKIQSIANYFYFKKKIDLKFLKKFNNKKTGNRSDDELISLKIFKLKELYNINTANILSGLSMLRKKGIIQF